MQVQERNQENYLQKVVPRQEAKRKKNDELVNMYIDQKQTKEDEAAMRKSKQQEMYKAQIMSSLDEQKVSKRQQDI